MGSLFFNFAPRCILLPENCNFHETFPLKSKLNKKLILGKRKKEEEKKPHLKLNFTTRALSIYLLRPFLKLGNGIGLVLVFLLHISTFKKMLTSKSSFSYVLCCNLVNISFRMESKVSFRIKILWAIQRLFLCMCSRTREINENKVETVLWDTLYVKDERYLSTSQ